MLKNGVIPSQNGRHLTNNSSEECKWLYSILQAINNLNGSINSILTPTPYAFTVGTTAGAPTNGASTWTISTINVIGTNPVFLLNGVPQVAGTNYTFNNATGVLTLSSTTFATAQVWTVLI
jgi:hypothetical protein